MRQNEQDHRELVCALVNEGMREGGCIWNQKRGTEMMRIRRKCSENRLGIYQR